MIDVCALNSIDSTPFNTFQLNIVSDIYSQILDPLREKLGFPNVFCHSFKLNADCDIVDYSLRQQDAKVQVVKAMQWLNYDVIAFGDSYNDIGMMSQADYGFFFNPPENIKKEYSQFTYVDNYKDLKIILKAELFYE